MPRRCAVFVASLFVVACQSSATRVTLQTMRLVTPSYDGQTLVVPKGPQHVALGAVQTFAVNANDGYAVASLVGGSCPMGAWSQNVYTTGATTDDCTVIFSSTQKAYSVSVAAAGNHAQASPSGGVFVASGASWDFTLNAEPGYVLTDQVGGTCPPGIWRGATYTTGAVHDDCTVSFAATPIYFMVTPTSTHVTLAPADVQTTLWSGQQTFYVSAQPGYVVDAQVGGSCAPGHWDGAAYTTGAVNGNCTVDFVAAQAVPTLTQPTLRTLGLTQQGSNANFLFAWSPPEDAGTPASEMQYTLCASAPDPAYGTFSTPSEVLAGAVCVTTEGIPQAELALPLGHAYYINVVAQNLTGHQAIYFAKGEFADVALVGYMPFEGAARDIVAGADLIAATYNAQVADTGAFATDRTGLADDAYAFAAQEQDCLATSQPLVPSRAGGNDRSITFWMSGDVNTGSFSPLSMGGDGNALVAGDHFGLRASVDTPLWQMWFGEEDATTGASYADNAPWAFWAITYSHTGVASLYVNGVLAGQTRAWPHNPDLAPSRLFVGCGIDGSAQSIGRLTNFFSGTIDDIRVFDRVLSDGSGTNGSLLASDEIGALFDVTRP